MNEIVALSTFALLCFAVAYAARLGLKHLYVLSVFIILASNVTVGIQVDMFGTAVSLGVIIYSIIYLVTDVVSEFFEENEAYKLAITNVVVQIMFWVYMFLSINTIPSGGETAYEAMEALFSTTARITVAALVASLGAFGDIWFYEWLLGKSRKKSKNDVTPGLWFRNMASTFFGQSINTAVFFTIALYGVVPNLLSIVLSAIAIKWAIAVLDTPFLYWARRIRENANN
ncbi:MAG: queuosine precursor transporter [Deltaproteobacteria bacterium]|jgi:hypothetical protein|nr:queuosine precursor transporter [Deltaproteobacteria bacterium]